MLITTVTRVHIGRYKSENECFSPKNNIGFSQEVYWFQLRSILVLIKKYIGLHWCPIKNIGVQTYTSFYYLLILQ